MTVTSGDDGADVAELAAGVHSDAAADGAGDAGQRLETGETARVVERTSLPMSGAGVGVTIFLVKVVVVQ